MKYEFSRNEYASEEIEGGQVRHFLDKVIHQDFYAVELADAEHLIFTKNGKSSKPVKVVYDSSWAWKAEKTQIKSNAGSAEKLYKSLSDPFWNCYTQAMCDKYCA